MSTTPMLLVRSREARFLHRFGGRGNEVADRPSSDALLEGDLRDANPSRRPFAGTDNLGAKEKAPDAGPLSSGAAGLEPATPGFGDPAALAQPSRSPRLRASPRASRSRCAGSTTVFGSAGPHRPSWKRFGNDVRQTQLRNRVR